MENLRRFLQINRPLKNQWTMISSIVRKNDCVVCIQNRALVLHVLQIKLFCKGLPLVYQSIIIIRGDMIIT